MELSLSTFILEMINFLVLVWILKKLFFIPVQRVIEERKNSISSQLQTAQNVQAEANALQAQYEVRLKEWELQKKEAQIELQEMLDKEQKVQLEKLEKKLDTEQSKREIQEKKDAGEIQQSREKQAIEQSLQFLTKLLQNIVCPELETKIIDLTLKQLSKSNETDTYAPTIEHYQSIIKIQTAFPLSEKHQKEIKDLILTNWKFDSQIEFALEPTLLAGIEIFFNSTVIRANLRDELKYFSEIGL